MAAGSGKQKPAKSTGKRPAVKTGEFKIAKTSPIIKAPEDEGDPGETGEAKSIDVAPAMPTVAKTASGKVKATSGALRARTASGRNAVVAAPASLPHTGNEIWITCRECLEEWTIDPERAKSQETIVCPVCEHRAQAPNDDILHQIALYKGIEERNFRLALGAFLVGVGAMFLWTLLTANPGRADDFAFFTLPLIIAGIALIATLFFTSKYENSKWTTYF